MIGSAAITVINAATAANNSVRLVHAPIPGWALVGVLVFAAIVILFGVWVLYSEVKDSKRQ